MACESCLGYFYKVDIPEESLQNTDYVSYFGKQTEHLNESINRAKSVKESRNLPSNIRVPRLFNLIPNVNKLNDKKSGLVYDLCYPNNISRDKMRATRLELVNTSIHSPNKRDQIFYKQ